MIEQYIKAHSSGGVIHVGANIGQERFMYQELGRNVLWIEPDPMVCEILLNNVSGIEGQKVLHGLVSDQPQLVRFNISNQRCRSSMFEFTEHHTMDDDFEHIETMNMVPFRLDLLDVSGYDVLVSDTQGADYNVIVSLGEKIHDFGLIICEVMKRQIYRNIRLEEDITDYLANMGFELISQHKYGCKDTQRDNVYRRRR